LIKQTKEEVDKIINYAIGHEDIDMINNKRHELLEAKHEIDQEILAINAPDRMLNDPVKENLKEVEKIIEDAAMINKQYACIGGG
jgi:hypothetical protein